MRQKVNVKCDVDVKVDVICDILSDETSRLAYVAGNTFTELYNLSDVWSILILFIKLKY